jgi:hypothetical protein
MEHPSVPKTGLGKKKPTPFCAYKEEEKKSLKINESASQPGQT